MSEERLARDLIAHHRAKHVKEYHPDVVVAVPAGTKNRRNLIVAEHERAHELGAEQFHLRFQLLDPRGGLGGKRLRDVLANTDRPHDSLESAFAHSQTPTGSPSSLQGSA